MFMCSGANFQMNLPKFTYTLNTFSDKCNNKEDHSYNCISYSLDLYNYFLKHKRIGYIASHLTDIITPKGRQVIHYSFFYRRNGFIVYLEQLMREHIYTDLKNYQNFFRRYFTAECLDFQKILNEKEIEDLRLVAEKRQLRMYTKENLVY